MLCFGLLESYFDNLATTAAVDPGKAVFIKIFNKSSHNLIDRLRKHNSNSGFRVLDDETFREF